MLKSIGDRLLSLFVPNVAAGACVPEAGKVCQPAKTYYYTCTGACK